MLSPSYGFIFIFYAMISYMTCVLYALYNLAISGYFSVVPLLSAQKFSHVFLVIGIFLARDELKRIQFNPLKIAKKSLEAAIPSIKFLLIISLIMLAVPFLEGRNVAYETIHFLIYLNLFLIFDNKSFR